MYGGAVAVLPGWSTRSPDRWRRHRYRRTLAEERRFLPSTSRFPTRSSSLFLHAELDRATNRMTNITNTCAAAAAAAAAADARGRVVLSAESTHIFAYRNNLYPVSIDMRASKCNASKQGSRASQILESTTTRWELHTNKLMYSTKTLWRF